MLDLRFIRENPDAVKAACARKRIAADVDRLLALDQRSRELKFAFDEKKAEQNRRNQAIGKLAGAEKTEALALAKALSEEVKGVETELKGIDEELRKVLLTVPNIPDPEVPSGKDDTENVEVRRVGTPRR